MHDLWVFDFYVIFRGLILPLPHLFKGVNFIFCVFINRYVFDYNSLPRKTNSEKAN